ncbi:MAG TPA: glycosyltransferase family 39 protein [Gemmatimonadaceae bacterium]|nr:glycosyltransferase family 39 protein [Gemmatimonadaceae bacterium]
MVILPLAALVALILGQRTASGSMREAILRGSVLWGFALVLLTEVLSVMTLLTSWSVAAGWAAVLTVALIWMRRRSTSTTTATVAWRVWRDDAGALSLAQILAIIVVAVVTLALALLAAPATEDSMVYHLPRVMHWIQDRSVAPYPTHIARQLWPSPGGSFVALHGQLLTGSDRSVPVVQWLAFIGDIVLASLVAKELGAKRKGQLFAAFFFALLPPAVAQASGAQVELIAAFWFGSAVVLGLQMMNDREETRSWLSVFLLGAAIGLAILTKTTAFIFLAPFVLWYLATAIRRGPGRAIGSWVVAGFVALALNAPHAVRNLATYDNPLGRRGGYGLVNSEFFPAGFISNVVRNTSLHFGTRSPRANLAVYSSVIGVHRLLGVSADDPRTTFPGLRYKPVRMEYAEQTAGAPIHVLLIVASALILGWKGGRKHATSLFLLLAVVTGFLLFSFYLRWQPWHSRLWVPLFVVGAGAVGVAFESILAPVIRAGIIVSMMLGVLPALVLNPPRPLVLRQPIYAIPRERQYFAEDYRPYTTYRDAADHLASAGCYDIAVWMRGDGAEYQLWAVLQTRAARVGRQTRIRHFLVRNESRKLVGRLSGDNFRPCAVVYIHPDVPLSALPVPARFNLVWERNFFRIYSAPADVR